MDGMTDGFPRVVRGAHGKGEIKSRPVRIVSLNLAADEMLLDLVEPERIAALTYLADDERNSNVRDRSHLVARKTGAQLAEVLALQPDLAIAAAYNDRKIIDGLHSAGVPVVQMPLPRSVAAMRDTLRLVASAVDAEDRATALIRDFDRRLASVAGIVDKLPLAQRPRVLYYSPEEFAAGPGGTYGSIIALAGGRNALTDDPHVRGRQITRDEAVAANPDVIVFSDVHEGHETWPDHLRADPQIAATPAGQQDRIHWMDDRAFNTMSHYIVAGVEQTARLLHPDHF